MNQGNIKNSLKYVLWNGISTAAADTVSSGTILIAFATMLGASNLYIGFIVSLPYFANLMNFFAGYLLENGYTCKTVAFLSSLISRPFYLLIALLPLLKSKEQILLCLFISIFLLYFSGNVTGGTFGVWMKNLVPERILGAFFAKRYQLMMAARILCYSCTYILLKNFKTEIHVYSIMFVLAFCLGMFTTITFLFMEDSNKKEESSNFYSNLKLCFKDKQISQLIKFIGIFNFLISFFFPFVSVFMLKSLGYSMDKVIMITIIFQLAYIFSTKFWGRLNDKSGLQIPLNLAFACFSVCIIGFMFLSWHHPTNSIVLLSEVIILQIVLGFINSAFVLATNNIPLVCIAEDKANTLIPTISAIKSLLAGCGSSFAGIFITYSLMVENKFLFANRDGWFLFFAFSLLICVYLIRNTKKLEKCQ